MEKTLRQTIKDTFRDLAKRTYPDSPLGTLPMQADYSRVMIYDFDKKARGTFKVTFNRDHNNGHADRELYEALKNNGIAVTKSEEHPLPPFISETEYDVRLPVKRETLARLEAARQEILGNRVNDALDKLSGDLEALGRAGDVVKLDQNVVERLGRLNAAQQFPLKR